MVTTPAGLVRDRTLLALSAVLLQIPFLRLGLSHLDEGSVLAIADSLHRGEVLYGNRLTHISPVTFELLAGFFDVFGATLLTARSFQALWFVGCVVLVHEILLRVVPRPWALAGGIAVLGIKSLAFPFWTVANYSQLALFLCLGSAYAAMRYLENHRFTWLAGAGLGIGLTLATKQNLGAYLSILLALAVAFDAIYERASIPRTAGRLGLLVFTACLPVAILLGRFAYLGTLDGFLERAVFGIFQLPGSYRLPLPSLRLWAFQLEEMGTLSFTYFPVAITQLSWQGELNLYSRATVFAIETAVKLIYYVPVLSMGAACVFLVRDGRRGLPRERWSPQALLALFAAMAFASMLYRPDWIHLTNVYPVLLLLCVWVFHRFVVHSRWARVPVLGLASLWIAAALGCGYAIFRTHTTPFETPAGKMILTPIDAESIAPLLDFLETRPAAEPILIFPAEPVFYFLARRPVPIRFEHIMPGLLLPGDDATLADDLARVDRVIFNPHIFPTVSVPVTDFAPRLVQTLATDFEVERVLSPRAIVLTRRDPAPDRLETRVDFWSEFNPTAYPAIDEDLDKQVPKAWPRSIERTTWLMYRVIATPLDIDRESACVGVRHSVETGDRLAFRPAFHPGSWSGALLAPPGLPVRFRIEIRTPFKTPRIVYESEQIANPMGDEREIDLAPWTGKNIGVRFCAELVLPEEDPSPKTYLAVGWAEPRIVRRR